MIHKQRRPRKQKHARQQHGKRRTGRLAATDILILSDGTVMAHNLTPGMAKVLHKLNPKDQTISARAGAKRKERH